MWAEFKDIEKLAFDNQPLPKYHYQFEQLSYLSMRCLYHDYRLGYLNKEQAQKERALIRNTFEQTKQDYQAWQEEQKRYGLLKVAMGKVNRDIELHGCELCQRMVQLMDGRLRAYENEKK